MRKLLFSLFLVLLLGGCATTQAGPNGLADRDPYEEFNRDIWSANDAVDDVLIRPVSEVYRTVAPRPVRSGITNFLRNLTEPWSFINNLLQGKPGRALRNLGRFIVNSTIGIGGLFDHASDIGIEPAPEDFGQTLAVWGVGDGGYRVVPLIGPTTGRGLVGSIVGFIADPATIFLTRELNLSTVEQLAYRSASVIDTRANLIDAGADAFLETSADPYAAARAAFFERREAEILDYDMAGLVGDEEAMEATEDEAFDAALEEFESDETDPPIAPEEVE